MRTSGGGGSETWIAVIPIVVLIVAASMASGGPNGFLMMLEGTIRTTVNAVIEVVLGLF